MGLGMTLNGTGFAGGGGLGLQVPAGYDSMLGYGAGASSVDPTAVAAPAPMTGTGLTIPTSAFSGINLNLNGNSPATANPWMPDWLKGAIGTKEAPGWGGMAVGAAGALANAFLGMQQYGLAKKTLAENQRQFNLNYGAQRSAVNSELQDRQRARIASNPGAYQSVGDYMGQYGIK